MIALLGDSHYRVVELAQETLCSLFGERCELMEEHLEETMPRVVNNISEKRESLSAGANELLGVLQGAYGGDRLVPQLLKMLDIRERMKTKTTAVEVLTVMLVEASEFCSSYANVKTLVARACALMHEHSSKRTVMMPCLGVVLAARDQNYEAVMKSAIQFVPPDHQAVLKEAARLHAPDLLENLESSQFRFSL